MSGMKPRFDMTLGIGSASFSVEGICPTLDDDLCALVQEFVTGLRPLVRETQRLNAQRDSLVDAGYAPKPKIRRIK